MPIFKNVQNKSVNRMLPVYCKKRAGHLNHFPYSIVLGRLATFTSTLMTPALPVAEKLYL